MSLKEVRGPALSQARRKAPGSTHLAISRTRTANRIGVLRGRSHWLTGLCPLGGDIVRNCDWRSHCTMTRPTACPFLEVVAFQQGATSPAAMASVARLGCAAAYCAGSGRWCSGGWSATPPTAWAALMGGTAVLLLLGPFFLHAVHLCTLCMLTVQLKRTQTEEQPCPQVQEAHVPGPLRSCLPRYST